jgi:nicotinate-nucleotide adenylyltransferase
MTNTVAVHAPHCCIQLRPELSHRYTIITLERAKALAPQAQFSLVIGSDLLPQLPQWHQAQTLLQQVHLLVIPRPHFPIQRDALVSLQQLTQVTIAQWEGLPVSSTIVRENGCTEPLTAPVHDFIQAHRLYPALLV